jgi:hypothetical protein
MIKFTKLRNVLSGLTLSVVVVAGIASGAHAAPAAPQTPPAGRQLVSGPQAKPEVEPGTKDAKQMKKLGPTDQVQTEADGKPSTNAVSPMAGAVSSVDFSTFSNYCWKNLVYTTVKNNTSSTQYIRAQVYSNGTYHDVYTSVAAGSYAYPAFYGIEGSYSAYLYVWNSSTSLYVYDEYKGGTNTCNVSVTRTYNTGGWVQLKIQNLGTAYASQVSTELAPTPASGTYTGTHYDYPTAGGAAIYRWFYVGTQPYGIASYTSGSTNSPYFFTGDL